MWKQVMIAAGTEEFGDRLEQALNNQNLSIKEFASRHDLSPSTLYKITSNERSNFGVKTLKNIIDALREEEGYNQPTIGLITTRDACDRVPNSISVDDVEYHVKPLPAHTIEEEIVKGVNAEKDGIDAILCGPIAATTIEQVVDVPVGGLKFDVELMTDSLESLIQRI